jgi:hypothetical protein
MDMIGSNIPKVDIESINNHMGPGEEEEHKSRRGSLKRRDRMDSDNSLSPFGNILQQFQNDNSFFDMSRPRIQSEFSPPRREVS